MHVEGDQVLALSDAGSLIHLALPATGPAQVAIRSLPDGPGSASSKFDRDVEAMTVHGGHAWLAFEGRNAIWRYNRGDWLSDAAFQPPAMRDWPGNDGGEAMLRLADGRRSEEHTSELQSLMRISYAVFCLKKKKQQNHT